MKSYKPYVGILRIFIHLWEKEHWRIHPSEFLRMESDSASTWIHTESNLPINMGHNSLILSSYRLRMIIHGFIHVKEHYRYLSIQYDQRINWSLAT